MKGAEPARIKGTRFQKENEKQRIKRIFEHIPR